MLLLGTTICMDNFSRHCLKSINEFSGPNKKIRYTKSNMKDLFFFYFSPYNHI